ncbi:sugar transferase [Haploplasma modicum]|uniref:sugar transferase n=1 Tax=Haploplasma modicum TaxID=2150 RepID=UPI00068E5A92
MKRKKTLYEMFLKRPIDLIFSIIALIILSPVFIVVGILVRIKLGGPILFKQDRPGKNEKIFKMYKFRTMTDEKDKNGCLLPDEIRLTKFGKTLRSTSLDELPGLLNIIKGDMSIVGPRPLLVQYLPLYNANQKKRHLVRPGLTGLAQVSGRNAISWDEKFILDNQYISKITMIGDLKIFFKTIFKVLKRSDINSNNHETMEYFTGNNDNQNQTKMEGTNENI